MELKFVDLEMFEAAAEKRLLLKDERFVAKDAIGNKVGISPGLSLHEDLTVLGTDFIPVRSNGVTTLEQMTHTPHQYLGKARNISQRDGRWVATPASHRWIGEPSLLAGGAINYYHWLLDNVPRILIARRYGRLQERLVLVNHDAAPFQLSSLQRMGIGEERLVRVEPREALELADCLVPAMLVSATVVHPMVPGLIREAFAPKPTGAKRRIYLCRQDAPTRQLVNEEAFAQLLERHGFERFMPSQMTFDEQVAACADAEALVAVHGAALASMLFSPPGAKVLEVYSPQHKAGFFHLLAHMCGHKHRFVPAALVDPRPDVSPLHHQWEADLGAMEAALAEAL